ncbi:MAG: sulfatase [Actinomycetia bacterium]|nr:sulfatase [Actinomycetes bacterium]
MTARRPRLWAFFELFALVGFVVAQPTLDVLGKAPDFFLFRQAGRAEILALVLAVTVLPALALWLAELAAGLAGERARQVTHVGMVGGLLAVLALEVGKSLTPVRGPGLVALGVAGGLLGGLAYATWPGLKLWLRYLAPAPLVFALVFLLVSPVSKLVLPQPGGTPAVSPSGRITPEHPVVLLLLDELPLTSLLDSSGRIDARLYPNFAKLAGQSTWYRNATAVSGLTNWAVPAMLSGRYPTAAQEETSPTAAQYPENLFTLLGASYPIEQFQVVTLRTTLRDSARVFKRIVTPRDVDENPTGAWLTADPEAGRKPRAASGGGPVSPILREIEQGNESRQYYNFVKSIEGSDPPTFYFLHLLLPHQPWRYLPDGRVYSDRGDGRNANGWTSEPWPPRLSRQRHLMQVAETDRLLGQVMRRLQEQRMYDDTLFVVTADHGMSFKPAEYGRRVATAGNVDQVLWVPTFIKQPGQAEGQVNDRNWEHVDLVPTLAEHLGIKVPWELDGVSQAGAEEPRARTSKWFFSKPGQRQEFPGPENQAKALAGVTDEMVRAGDGYPGWFQFGPHADLVGRRPGEVGVDPASAGSARVEQLAEYRRVDPGSGLVPAQVSGQVSLAAGVPDRPAVAVAVNGVVAGVSETFRERRDAKGSQPVGPPDKFSALTLDTVYRKGENRLELFVIDDSGGRVRLRPLAVS